MKLVYLEAEVIMELREYLEDIKRWAWMIIAAVVCSIVTAGAISSFFLDKVYEASTTIAIGNRTEKTEVAKEAYIDVLSDESMVKVFCELALSSEVIEQTVLDLKLQLDAKDLRSMIKINSIEHTGIIKISAENKHPDLAQGIAVSLVKNLQSESERINLAGRIYVIDAARLPAAPAKPRTVLNILVAGAAGLMAGMVLALILEYMDDTVKSIRKLQEATGTIVLGAVPCLRSKNKFMKDIIDGTDDSFKILRTKVLNVCRNNSLKIILVTSPVFSEGKTVIAANLAASIGQLGAKVLLMDCNLQMPSLYVDPKEVNIKGISDFLVEKDYSIDACTFPDSNLDVIFNFTKVLNSSELLNSPKMAALTDILRQSYDIVVIDSPPVLPGADAEILSKLVDGVILVVSYGQSKFKTAVWALESLKSMGTSIVGTVFNKIPAQKMFSAGIL